MEDITQYPCDVCHRTFREEVLQRHKKICKKQATAKRKVFDSSKQRAEGTDIPKQSLLHTKKNNTHIKPQNPTKSHWKEKHEDFINAVRSARQVDVAMKTGKPLPPPVISAVPSDYINCPSCGRNFNAKAAERHISFCAEKQARVSGPSKQINATVKARMEARKYQAPKPKAKTEGATDSTRRPSFGVRRETGKTGGYNR